jgi:hypothetical protein
MLFLCASHIAARRLEPEACAVGAVRKRNQLTQQRRGKISPWPGHDTDDPDWYSMACRAGPPAGRRQMS